MGAAGVYIFLPSVGIFEQEKMYCFVTPAIRNPEYAKCIKAINT